MSVLAPIAGALGGPVGIGMMAGSIIVPMIVEAFRTHGPTPEAKQKIQGMLQQLAMAESQKSGIPLAEALKQITADVGPQLDKAFTEDPGLLASLLPMLGGMAAGGAVGAGIKGLTKGGAAAAAGGLAAGAGVKAPFSTTPVAKAEGSLLPTGFGAPKPANLGGAGVRQVQPRPAYDPAAEFAGAGPRPRGVETASRGSEAGLIPEPRYEQPSFGHPAAPKPRTFTDPDDILREFDVPRPYQGARGDIPLDTPRVARSFPSPEGGGAAQTSFAAAPAAPEVHLSQSQIDDLVGPIAAPKPGEAGAAGGMPDLDALIAQQQAEIIKNPTAAAAMLNSMRKPKTAPGTTMPAPAAKPPAASVAAWSADDLAEIRAKDFGELRADPRFAKLKAREHAQIRAAAEDTEEDLRANLARMRGLGAA